MTVILFSSMATPSSCNRLLLPTIDYIEIWATDAAVPDLGAIELVVWLLGPRPSIGITFLIRLNPDASLLNLSGALAGSWLLLLLYLVEVATEGAGAGCFYCGWASIVVCLFFSWMVPKPQLLKVRGDYFVRLSREKEERSIFFVAGLSYFWSFSSVLKSYIFNTSRAFLTFLFTLRWDRLKASRLMGNKIAC